MNPNPNKEREIQGHTQCHTAGQSRQEEDLKSSHREKRTVPTRNRH